MLLSIEELQSQIKTLNVDTSKSYTENKKLFDTDIKKSIEFLFTTTGLHRKTLVYLLFKSIDPTTHKFACLCCGEPLNSIHNNPNIQKTNFCTKSCAQRYRRIVDPDYQTRMVEKAKIKRSKVDPMTGLTPAQVGSKKTAEIKRQKGSYDEISKKIVESNRKTFEKRLNEKYERMRKILEHRGVRNFVRFLIRNRKKQKFISGMLSIKTVIKHLTFCEETLGCDTSKIDVVQLWSDITGNSLYRVCDECGIQYQSRKFDDNWNLEVISNTKFCSDKCCSEHRTKSLSLLPKRVLSDERKKQISINSKRAHARNPEMGKNVSAKAIETMRREGKLGARRDKALQTKLERGVIAEIRFDKKSPERLEYTKYNKLVWRLTKSQPLNNFDKRGKRLGT